MRGRFKLRFLRITYNGSCHYQVLSQRQLWTLTKSMGHSVFIQQERDLTFNQSWRYKAHCTGGFTAGNSRPTRSQLDDPTRVRAFIVRRLIGPSCEVIRSEWTPFLFLLYLLSMMEGISDRENSSKELPWLGPGLHCSWIRYLRNDLLV